MPGFLLSGLYLVYIICRRDLKPGAAPKLPPEYGPQTRKEFWIALWRGLFPMTALLVIVLGSIFAGWATPTESGARGRDRLDVHRRAQPAADDQDAERGDLLACRANGLVFLIFLGATGFSYVFRVLGGDELMISTLAVFRHRHQVGDAHLRDGADLPARLPVRVDRDLPDRAAGVRADPREYDFSDHIGNNAALMTWFGTLVAVNLQTAFMTPPFGATLFYMKGTAPPGVTMSDVYGACIRSSPCRSSAWCCASTSRASSCGCRDWRDSSNE